MLLHPLESIKFLSHKIVRGRQLKRLNYGNKDDEFFLVSFPKSGNTWIRFILANLIKPNDVLVTLKNIGEYVPDIHVRAQRDIVFDKNSAFYNLPFKVVKSHDEYLPFFQNKQIIYVVRDGRDALTSYFYYHIGRSLSPPSLRELIEGKNFSLHGSWSKHVIGWTKGKSKSKLILKYEDMLNNPQEQTMKLVEFLSYNVTKEQIEQAISNSSIKQLREIEEKYGGVNDRNGTPKNIPFFRKGEKNDYKNLFKEDDLELFWKYHKKAMALYGYE